MIFQVKDPHERAEAVDFVMRIVRPDIPADVRRKRALNYAFMGTHCGLDTIDADPNGGIEFAMGRIEFPIFACRRNGELAGVIVCSGMVEGIPLRVVMVGVRADHRGEGIGSELVRTAMLTAPVVGVLPARPDLRPFFQNLGFWHWRDSASGPDAEVGFTKSTEGRSDMLFVVPVALVDQLAERDAWLQAHAEARRD